MPEVTCKIINDDGTEKSFGPFHISDEDAHAVVTILEPGHEQFWTDAIAYGEAEVAAVNEQRSADAEAANQARIEAAERGEEID